VEIETALSLPKKDWLEILELRPMQYQKILRGEEDLSVRGLYSLTESLNISSESFDRGKIDLKALREHWNKNWDYMPERYTVGAFSKGHTMSNALRFVERKRGPGLRHMVNRVLQTHDSMWEQLDRPINMVMLTDTFDFLAQRGFRNADFVDLGKNTFATLKHTDVGKKMGEHTTYKSICDFTFNSFMPAFEQNCRYKILSLTHEHCLIEGITTERLSEALKVKHAGNQLTCLVKSGIISSITRFIGRPHSHVSEPRCVHRGDPVCRFVMRFPPAYRSQSLSSSH
jgi:hypothetical protein